MISFERYLENQRHRLIFFGLLQAFFYAAVVFTAAFSFFFLMGLIIVPAVSLLTGWESIFFGLSGIASLLAALFVFYQNRHLYLDINLATMCRAIENQSNYFKENPLRRSELETVGAFLDHQDHPTRSYDFQSAHIEQWKLALPKFAVALRPRYRILGSVLLVFLLMGSMGAYLSISGVFLPSQIRPWNPEQFEILLPHQEATWQIESGALSGVERSQVRFEAPDFGLLTPYLFVKELNQKWRAIACEERCEMTLRDRGRYAVGTLFYRSAFFPLQVFADEKPKGVLFAKQGEELIPEAIIELLNVEDVDLHMTASDDIEIKKIRLLHRFEAKEEVLYTREVGAERYKADFTLSVEGWEGGDHEVLLEVSDATKSFLSLPIVIRYADEDTLREKRLASLEAMITEWVHVLGDLIETEMDEKIHPMLRQRLQGMGFPDPGESELIRAYIKELSLLRDRILTWQATGQTTTPNFGEVPELIERVERQILYGLSLVFQEKSGDVRSSSEKLTSSRESIEELLNKVREGEKALNSEDLQKAFDKLNAALEELRDKMQNLPSGPGDEMINREALQEQMDQSQQLSERIKQIQEQIQSGDDEGALNELESLMNQLSILSKSIDRALQQMQENVDKGAVQASREFLEKIKEIRERQENLETETTELKEKLEAQQEAAEPMSAEDQEILEQMIQEAESKQQALQQDLLEGIQTFNEKMEGSEWEALFRGQETKNLENEAVQNMSQAERAIRSEQGFQAIAEQREAIEALRRLEETQQQQQNQAMQSVSQGVERQAREKVDIISSQGKGERERRRKILESLQKKVDEPFQKSHERYFEELLQR